MKTKLAILIVAAIISGRADLVALAQAEEIMPTLRCVIAECSPAEDCVAPFTLSHGGLPVIVGSDFLFQLTDDWDITPGGYHLQRRYSGNTIMTKVTLTLDIDRASKNLSLKAGDVGTGVTPRSVVASGTCEEISTLPMIF
jgi:hypothetical protein